MNNNRCLYCNEIIPEGRMVCFNCERVQMKMGMILQSLNATEEQVKTVYNAMEKKDDN